MISAIEYSVRGKYMGSTWEVHGKYMERLRDTFTGVVKLKYDVNA